MSKQAFKRVRRSLGMEVCRKPLDSFAWPGGYPIFYITKDCAALCPDCANENIDLVDVANRDRDTQWHIIAAEVNWEDEYLSCDHCSKQIESAYGEVEEVQS